MRLDIQSVLTGLTEFEVKAKVAIELYANTAAKKLENEAKNNGPWTDRTGLSRKTITSGTQWDGNKCGIFISGNTAQFPYLELAMDKKYATLQPAVNKLSPEILRGMNNLLGR
jgi:hypothetical protein